MPFFDARRRDTWATWAIWTAALLVTALFFWILGDLIARGGAQLSWSLLLEAPRDAGRAGGLLPILASTLLILAVCLLASTPIALAAAILLAEYLPRRSSAGQGWFARSLRFALDLLAGIPSIVYGLFGNAFFCIYLGLGFSILAGGLTLACMVLPILIRATEDGLAAVPDDYRRAAAALALSRAATLGRILLPAALPALVVGMILGVGRALAETAALLFTSGYVDRMPESLADSGRALSIHVYDLAMNVPGGEARANAAALVLIAALLLINWATSAIGGVFRRKWVKQ